VRDFKNLGFNVVYGTIPSKAFNAFIWFETGPFIELFQIRRNRFVVNVLKIIGKKGVANRVAHFQNSDFGWSDYSIENSRYDLKKENTILKQMGYQYSTMPGLRADTNGNKLKWKLSMPYDLDIPFLMSLYNVDPRPKAVKHPNGAKEVKQLTWGVSIQNISNIERLVHDVRLKLVEGKGFQDVIIRGFDNDVLTHLYYE
jgi:hypothetical protein